METKGVATLQRDVKATLIPAGTPIDLPVGTQVMITQELGGYFTVYAGGHLARIEGKDAEALGREVPKQDEPETVNKEVTGSVDVDLVWEQLRTCYDPEIPVNMVDLGLIYRCEAFPIYDDDNNESLIGNRVEIDMTLTAPGCGMAGFFLDDIKKKTKTVPNVTEVKIELVFDPPWDQSMMSDEARLKLGLL